MWTTIILGVFSILMGLVLLVLAASMIRTGANSYGWPATQGVVQSTGIRHAGAVSIPEVRYSYSVNGSPLQGSITLIGGKESFREQLTREYVDSMPVGKHVPVYYNPARPSQSALEVGFARWVVVRQFGLGLACVAGGVALVLVAH